MKERQKQFQGDVQRLRNVLHRLTLQQPDALGARVASLQRTINGQTSRSGRAAAVEAAAKAAAAAAAVQQERMFGGVNVCVEEMRAGDGMQLLLIDPLFEFHEGTHALLSTGMSPQLLLHAQVRCHVALTRAGQERCRAVVQPYLDAVQLLNKLCMFGGSDDAVAEAARGTAAAVCEMQELLQQPQLQSGDLHRLLSLNAAHFLDLQPMRRALLAVLSEQLQACTDVAQVLRMWPQLVQQCSPRFLAFPTCRMMSSLGRRRPQARGRVPVSSVRGRAATTTASIQTVAPPCSCATSLRGMQHRRRRRRRCRSGGEWPPRCSSRTTTSPTACRCCRASSARLCWPHAAS
jgi:hypothetical protein